MIDIFFDPIDTDKVAFQTNPFLPCIGDIIDAYRPQGPFPEVPQGGLVLFGIPEERGAVQNSGCSEGCDIIRHYLYRLVPPHSETKLVDLGNLRCGNSLDDTYVAIAEVGSLILEKQATLLLLGGSQDILFGIYKAFETLSRIVNICTIDSRFGLGGEAEINTQSYLKHIVMQQPNYLFNFTNIGYQTYFVGNEYVKLMQELNFDAYRVGAVQAAINCAEPLVRNADIIGASVSSVRQSDAPGNANPSPHGFYGEQLCQIARFAGMSDKVSVFYLADYNPRYDLIGQTAHMLAHAAWFFIEGYFNRLDDNPYGKRYNYQHFTVDMQSHGIELVFLKSKRSERWWMEVPCDDDERRERYARHLLIPCNESEYRRALDDEIPELWWKYYERMRR